MNTNLQSYKEHIRRIPNIVTGRTVGTFTILESISYEEWYQIYEDNGSGECSFKKINKKEFDRIIMLIEK